VFSGGDTILGEQPGEVRGLCRCFRVKRTPKDSTDSTTLSVCAMSASFVGHGTEYTSVPFFARPVEEEDRKEKLLFLWIVGSVVIGERIHKGSFVL